MAQEWHLDARAAECVMRELATRIGYVPPEAPVPSHPPAALVADECPIDVGGSQRVRYNTRVAVVDTASGIPKPIDFRDSHISAAEAVTVGWAALRAFRSWEVPERLPSGLAVTSQPGPRSSSCPRHVEWTDESHCWRLRGPHGTWRCCPPDRAFGIESRRTVGRPLVPTTSVDSNWLQFNALIFVELAQAVLRASLNDGCAAL